MSRRGSTDLVYRTSWVFWVDLAVWEWLCIRLLIAVWHRSSHGSTRAVWRRASGRV